ncbi:uncharacterized protein PG986_010411 [Apiospora aurea]|uniref:Cytochrome P450 n=1 Tax=Apiospora aurea TaxID=335848 RepID=A0ABR1Q291_9PEZI
MESNTLLLVSGAILFTLAILKLQRNRLDTDQLTSAPNVGTRSNQFFAHTRAAFRSITATASTVYEGYNRFCKAGGSPFSIPNLGNGSITVLPPSQFDILHQTESDIKAFPIQMEVMQPRYLMGDHDEMLFKNAIQFDVVRKYMNKDVGYFAAGTADELDNVFRNRFRYPSGSAVTADVWDTCLQIIGRTANRAIIGLPLCRNEVLLEQSTKYANAVFQGASLISSFPAYLRPIVGPVIGLAAKGYSKRCKRIMVPYVDERLQEWRAGSGTENPNDAIQWIIERSAKGDPSDLEPNIIAQRLLILQLVSIYTTTYALSNILVNLYSSESKDDFIAGLRSECDRVAAGHNGLSSKEAIDQLYRLDSTVRESLRISPFSVIAPLRIVGSPGGIDLGNGIHLPRGARLGVPFQALHHDAEFYPNPLQFDAFRYSREFEGSGVTNRQATEQETCVTASKTFVTFGYGRHLCPGRWYTSQTLKQALAYLIQNYDVEFEGHRKQPRSLLNIILPPLGARINIRQRVSAVQ